MEPWVIALIVIGALLLIGIIAVIAWWISTYNKLVEMRQRVKNGWSQIDVQLKKRYDLIPNLVETVKGYAKHESETIKDVTMWRSRATSAGSAEEVMKANNELSGALSRLLVSVENYPDLKANTNFLQLQAELKDIESKIAFARQFYNDVAQKNNEMMEKFPSNIVANHYKNMFSVAEYFEVEEIAKEAPKVSF